MFETAIREWLVLTSGVTNVKQAPYRGQRPDADYATYQINAVAPMANGFKTTYAPATSIDTRHTSAIMTVSVNVYAPDGYAALAKAHAANDWWEARQILSPASMVFAQGGQINNLTALGDTDWRSRWQSDLTFHVDLTSDRIRYLIGQWIITGEFTYDPILRPQPVFTQLAEYVEGQADDILVSTTLGF